MGTIGRECLFPGVLLGGYECATHIDRTRRRQDFVVLTDHERQCREDYERAYDLGIRTIREGLRWHLIDRGGRYDFSSIEPMVDAGLDIGITHIHCLFHYGYPDDLDPLTPEFVVRFRDFAAAFAQWRSGRVPGPRWYCAANEPSMLAFASGEAGWFAPFLTGKSADLKVNLARAAISATDAIRAEDPEARFVAIDPIVHVISSQESGPESRSAAERNEGQYRFWDMLIGRECPELGGRPGYLDVVGVNAYPDNQFDSEGKTLAIDDPRRRPMREMLLEVWHRYHRPIIIAETSARRSERPGWLRMIADEYIAALEAGADMQGICLYPLVDMPEWKYGEVGQLGQLGLWDLTREGETLRRVLNRAYCEAVLEVQCRLQTAHRRATQPPKKQLTIAEQSPRNGNTGDGPSRNGAAHAAQAAAKPLKPPPVPVKG